MDRREEARRIVLGGWRGAIPTSTEESATLGMAVAGASDAGAQGLTYASIGTRGASRAPCGCRTRR